MEKKVQQRTIESREKINRAAYQLFSEKGYYNTNTKEIAKLAGVSVGNFYNYYQDKGDVYLELTTQYMNGSTEAVSQLAEIMLTAEDPKQMFRAYVYAQMERAGGMGRFFTDAVFLARDDEKLRKVYDDGTVKTMQILEHMFKEMKGVRKRASHQVMARMIYNVVNELTIDIMSTKGTPIYEEYLDQLISLVLEYLYGEE